MIPGHWKRSARLCILGDKLRLPFESWLTGSGQSCTPFVWGPGLIVSCSYTLTCGSSYRNGESPFYKYAPLNSVKAEMTQYLLNPPLLEFRGLIGFASLTVSARPLNSLPLSWTDCMVSTFFHLNKAKSLRSAGVTVRDDTNRLDRTRLCE